MLARLHEEIEAGESPRLSVYADGKACFGHGAFAYGTKTEWKIRVPRRLGAMAVVLRLWQDERDCAADGSGVAGYRDYPFSFEETDAVLDTYRLTLPLDAALFGEVSGKDAENCDRDGLFYCRLLFLRGTETLFSASVNEVDFTLTRDEADTLPFRLTVYRRDFVTPEWLSEGVMYHVFVDRFCRGAGEVTNPDHASLNEDWEGGIPEFAEKPGDPLDNHTHFGGNLWGVIEKLPYLRTLGVTVLYLSPIFRAYSNHKYDTGDYETVDGLFGGDAALDALLCEAKKCGISVMLDGVFNHTGDDSRYFNRRGTYPEVGAYQSKQSPYADWYTFRHFPDDYECWWNIPIMPRLSHESLSCRRYFTDPQTGIVARLCRRGVAGWRLDVADELSDAFLDELRVSVRGATDGQGAVLGEVWENAADKIAYGSRRRYLRGNQLDSVMNYPLRQAIIAFVRDGDGRRFYDILTELYASYPRPVCDVLMNLLGTHDTERILTVLGGEEAGERSNRALSTARMEPDRRAAAVERLMVASTLQYTVFGIPSLYYGDEAGMEGYHDPFCRMPFPWGHEDAALMAHYRRLGEIRGACTALAGGDFRFVSVTEKTVVYERERAGEILRIAAHVGEQSAKIPLAGRWEALLGGGCFSGEAELAPMRAEIYRRL